MEFILSNLSIANGARFVGSGDEKKLIITCHITSKIKDFPYLGKFEQVDYGIDIELPQNILPIEIEIQLPIIVQAWITNKYPTI